MVFAGGLSLFSLALCHGERAAHLASGARVCARADCELVFGKSALALACHRSPWLPFTISFPTSRAARCVLTPRASSPSGAWLCSAAGLAQTVDWRPGSCVDGQRECRSQHHDANSRHGYLPQHAWHLQRARHSASSRGLLHRLWIGLFCRGRPARGCYSITVRSDAFFRLLDSRKCAGYLRLH